MCLVSKILSAFLLNHAKISEQPNTNYKLKKKITADVTFSFTNPSLLLSKTQNLTLCSDKRRKKRGGILSQNLFFDCIISHLISKCYFLSLYLSPGFFHLMICRTRIVYSVSDWTLLEKKEKTHTSEHRFNARTRVWNTLLKSTCTGFVKIHKNHSDTAAHTVNGVHSNVQPQTHSQTHAHTHMMTYM